MTETECGTFQIEEIRDAIEAHHDPLDLNTLAAICRHVHIGGHLAALSKPYLEKILDGRKRIESRFGKTRTLPYQRVSPGDVLFLKETGGPITALGMVEQVNYFGPLSPGDARRIMDQYQEGLSLEPEFKREKSGSRYASLIYVGQVLPISPRIVNKRDRRPWVDLSTC